MRPASDPRHAGRAPQPPAVGRQGHDASATTGRRPDRRGCLRPPRPGPACSSGRSLRWSPARRSPRRRPRRRTAGIRPRRMRSTRITSAPECLAAFWTASEATEVGRRLHGRGESPHAVRDDLHRDRTVDDRLAKRGGESALREQPRVDAARQVHQACRRRRRRPAPGPRGCASARSGARWRQGLGETQVHRERDQVLLGTVVDVALEQPALVVLQVDQPLARPPQLVGASRQLGASQLELRAQPGPAQDETCLPGQTPRTGAPRPS